jgi:rare lipoprotein A
MDASRCQPRQFTTGGSETLGFGLGRASLPISSLLLLVAVGCSPKSAPATEKRDPRPAFRGVEEGVASWYGHPFHGRRTASGEVYDMEKMTAAHRELPFGTQLRVENLQNGKVAEVRINDRGPFVKGRILDLSRAAARELGILGPGTARVRLLPLAQGAEEVTRSFLVQVGSFSTFSRARTVVLALEEDGFPVLLETFEGMFRVRAGPFLTREDAAKAAQSFAARGLETWILDARPESR